MVRKMQIKNEQIENNKESEPARQGQARFNPQSNEVDEMPSLLSWLVVETGSSTSTSKKWCSQQIVIVVNIRKPLPS